MLDLDLVVSSKWLIWLKLTTAFQVAIDETGKTYPVKLTGAIGGHSPELAAGMSGKVLLSPP